jgi:cytoskeletal protein CcmA (bactofilin family)
MAKNNEMENHTINLIGNGTSIDGNITSSGDIRIDGNLKGNLTTKGKVIIGDTGKVNGEVHCKNFEIEGSLDGKIFVNELLSLRARSKVLGDISTSKLAIEPGAVFTGKCDMSGSIQNPYATKPAESKEK